MAVSRPVVFVPGLPGSHLKKVATDDLIFLDVSALLLDKARILPDLCGPDDPDDVSVVAAHPIRTALRFLVFDLAKQAQSLYDILGSIGYETSDHNDFFRPVGWDWRKPVDDRRALADVEDAVLDLGRRTGRKPVAIVHSTGGLVLRALLEAKPELADALHAVIAFGVPWGGTLRSLPLLCGKGGFGTLSPAETQLVLAHSWAAFDLLPFAKANDDLGLTLDSDGAPVDILARRDWFDDGLSQTMALRADHSQALHAGCTPEMQLGGRTLPVTNVVGFGAATLLRSRIDAAGVITFDEGKDDQALDDGDGTVPRRSAAWLHGDGVRTFHLPIGLYPGVATENVHNTLWANPGGQDLLWNLLGDEPWLPFVYAALDQEDVNAPADTIRVRLVAADEHARKLPNLTVELSSFGRTLPAEKKAEQPGGRLLFTVPRTKIAKTSDGRFRRLEVKISWKGAPEPVSRRFLIRP
jgi:hypothetical protein